LRLCERLRDAHHGMTQDELESWAGDAIGKYNRCAARHKALSDWARGK